MDFLFIFRTICWLKSSVWNLRCFRKFSHYNWYTDENDTSSNRTARFSVRVLSNFFLIFIISILIRCYFMRVFYVFNFICYNNIVVELFIFFHFTLIRHFLHSCSLQKWPLVCLLYILIWGGKSHTLFINVNNEMCIPIVNFFRLLCEISTANDRFTHHTYDSIEWNLRSILVQFRSLHIMFVHSSGVFNIPL